MQQKTNLITKKNNEHILPKNYIALDTDKKQLIINLDSPTELSELDSNTEIWGIVIRAPQANVEMNLQSLTIKTTGDISLQTPDDSFILLNTTREQHKKWLEQEKLLREYETKNQEIEYTDQHLLLT